MAPEYFDRTDQFPREEHMPIPGQMRRPFGSEVAFPVNFRIRRYILKNKSTGLKGTCSKF